MGDYQEPIPSWIIKNYYKIRNFHCETIIDCKNIYNNNQYYQEYIFFVK